MAELADYWVLVIAAPSRLRRTYIVANATSPSEARELALEDPAWPRWYDETVTVCHVSEVETNGDELYVDASDFRTEPTPQEVPE